MIQSRIKTKTMQFSAFFRFPAPNQRYECLLAFPAYKAPNQEINGMNAFWHSPSMNAI